MHLQFYCIFLAFFWTIHASSEHGECYTNKSMEGIEFYRFLNGSWLEKERNYNGFESSCDGIKYNTTEDHLVLTFFEENLDRSTGYLDIKKESIVIELNETHYSYNVITTDYNSYAVVYACPILEENQASASELIWILSRSDAMINSSETLLAEHQPLMELLKNNECKNETLPTEDPSETIRTTEPPIEVNSTTVTNLNTTLSVTESSPTTSINTTPLPSETTVNDPDSESTTKVPEETTTSRPPLIPSFYINGSRVFFLSQLYL